MLGAFLGVGEQFLLQGAVLFGGFAAPPRAGDRTNLNFAVLTANMDFRRSADEGKARQFEQEHVRRRIDRAGGAIDVQRRRLDRSREALRADDLDDVAGSDVLLCLQNISSK